MSSVSHELQILVGGERGGGGAHSFVSPAIRSKIYQYTLDNVFIN